MTLDVFLPWFVGAIAAPLIQYLKKWLGLEDQWAMVLTLVVSVVGGVIAAFATGEVTLADFSVENALAAAAKVLAVATSLYALLKKRE